MDICKLWSIYRCLNYFWWGWPTRIHPSEKFLRKSGHRSGSTAHETTYALDPQCMQLTNDPERNCNIYTYVYIYIIYGWNVYIKAYRSIHIFHGWLNYWRNAWPAGGGRLGTHGFGRRRHTVSRRLPRKQWHSSENERVFINLYTYVHGPSMIDGAYLHACVDACMRYSYSIYVRAAGCHGWYVGMPNPNKGQRLLLRSPELDR